MRILNETEKSLNFRSDPLEIRRSSVKTRAPHPDLGWRGVVAGELRKFSHIRNFYVLQVQSFLSEFRQILKGRSSRGSLLTRRYGISQKGE
ncbi:hypothetical protein CH380_04030 [Leptospira adleri]|uniref:Uncharacterized protein n=1 Tax=Leptospira adleri TaxID=2023186 RepID=A0A2M9YTL8_9LEPT|nr:hypothetical protein CH380_04030 [Leptospira adleri]PJZ60056.1 hypothetical protein CH376_20475 [Leptospira adleri]